MDRWQNIVNAIQTRLQTIQTTNGYRTNAGSTVLIFYSRPLEESQLPAMNVKAIEEMKADEGKAAPFNIDRVYLSVTVEIYVESGETSYSLARQVIEDARQAVGVDDTWGGNAMTTFWRKDKILVPMQKTPEATASIVAAGYFSFDIWYENKKYQSA